MDSTHAEAAPPSIPLKYQTWFLKVSIHCEGCRRKVKKVLQNIDGVFTTTIDQQQQKVTVTGSVAVETLLRKLLRAGKHAEVWTEKLAAEKPKNKSDNKEKSIKSLKNHSPDQKQSNESSETNNKKEGNSSISKKPENSPGKSTTGHQSPPENHNGGGGGGGGGGSVKKKKKKCHSGGGGGNVRNNDGFSSGSSGAPAHTGFQFRNEGQDVMKEMGQVNLSPPRQHQPYLYPSESGYPPPMMYVAAAYNRLYQNGSMGGPCYYVPPTPSQPYTCAGLDQESYYYHQFQSRPLVSFEIFSDENANGCSVM